jgi:ADP-heptose:LPS heptosyltransferase
MAVTDKRGSAICLIGDGLGNVIEQTCMVQAVQTLYKPVDIWMPRSTPSCLGAMQDMPGIRDVWIGKQPYPPGQSQRSYVAAFHSFLIGSKFLRQLKFRRRFAMKNPRRGQDAAEAELAMQAIRAAGYIGKTPKPYCGWDDCVKWQDDHTTLGISTGGNSRPVWRWKRYQRWAEIVDYLHKKVPLMNIALLGVDADDPINRPFVVDYRGTLPFRQSAGLVRSCNAFLANDNGLSHTAAALGVRTFTLFGPTRVVKNAAMHNTVPIYHPSLDCRPCQYSKCRMGRRMRDGVNERCDQECLSELDPIMVANQVLRYLGYAELCDIGDGTQWYPLLSGDNGPV